MIDILDKITFHFNSNLIKRKIDPSISPKLTDEEILIISQIGLPNDILDFQFTDDIYALSESEIIIGKTLSNNHLILDLESRKIKRNDQLFISKSLRNLILQLYIYDCLWENDIPQQKFGHYREDKNHRNYAKFLETELLKIDETILKSDNGGLWTSLIEDIEFGIVG